MCIRDSSGTTWDELLKARVDSYNNTVGDLTGYDCPICKNKGSIEIIKNGESFVRRCKCMDVRESIHIIKKSGLMHLIDRYTLDNFNTDEPWQKNIKQAAQEYVKAVSYTHLDVYKRQVYYMAYYTTN